MDRVWRPLPVAPHPAVPPLLVATTFGPTSYYVAVTDLERVWSESLDRRAICMRAFQENTTIDPSYDSEQMGVFLDKIKAAFGRSSGPDDDAADDDNDDAYSLSLAAASSGGDDLVLHITCTLPGDLPPLKWPLKLSLSRSASPASLLVQPLLRDRARRQRSTAALITALRQKDAVIAKLVDKLDALGAGAESAFPSLLPSGGGGAGSRRAGPRASRADMERRIKGLAPFDEAVFWKQLDEASPGDMSSLLSRFGELPCGEDDDLTAQSDWWQSLGKGKGVALTRTVSGLDDGRESLQDSSQTEAAGAAAAADDDDGFQTTPARAVKTATATTSPPSPTPARTTSKHTLDAAPSKPKKGLGKIGGGRGAASKKPDEEPAKQPAEQPAEPPLPVGADDETASEAEEPPEEKKKAPEAATEKAGTETVAAVRPRPARGGLGRIGGKKGTSTKPERSQPSELETAEPEPAEPVSTEEAAPEPSETPPPAARKPRAGLGRIGRGAKKEATDTHEDSDGAAEKRKADTIEEPPAPPAITETKRAEVLQQAVAKNAAPVRKKRKF